MRGSEGVNAYIWRGTLWALYNLPTVEIIGLGLCVRRTCLFILLF